MKENEKLSLVDLGKRLLEASRNGQADVVKELMQNGAPFTTDWLGTSPLHLAAQHGHTQTAEQLLRSGVSRDARTKVNRTPLHMAAQNGHLAIVELLISFGACVDNTDMLNMTPLHWACEYNHTEIIKALLQAGAHSDIVNKFGKTALDIAGKKNADVSAALLNAEQETSGGNKSPDSIKRPAERASITVNSVKKRQRTKKFPMTAGSWTGSDATPSITTKNRKRSAGASLSSIHVSTSNIVTNGRRLSAPAQYQNAGSPSLRSPTENSIASLVSAAELVKSKAEAQGSSAATTTAQEASVLDTLATLATATLSHNTGPTPSSTTQHVTAISGRGINVAPLTLTTGTASHAPTGLTTPLTPSTLFPLQSPLAALSALTALSTPTQTSPLPNIAMSPLTFQMPVNLTPQQLLMSGTQLVSSVSQQGSVPTASVMSTAESSNTSSSVDSSSLLNSLSTAHALLPQQFLAYAGGGNTGHFLTQIPQAQARVEQDKPQDSSEAKPEDQANQQGQEMYVTVQVPTNLQPVQPQTINEGSYTLQPVIVHPAGNTDQGLITTQTTVAEKPHEQPSTTTTSSSQVVQLQLPSGMISQSPGQLVQIPGLPEPITLAQLQQLLVNQNMAGSMQQVVISPQKIQLAPSSPLQVSNQAAQPTQTQSTHTQIPQQPQQQQISQQLLQQSIPQGLLHQNVSVDLQQPALPASIPSQVLLQVHEDFRKLIEQQKVEEERQRKELEEKVMALEQHSKKYRSELEIAQKAAETYRDQLQAESRERVRLLQLYESPKKGSDKPVTTAVESTQK